MVAECVGNAGAGSVVAAEAWGLIYPSCRKRRRFCTRRVASVSGGKGRSLSRCFSCRSRSRSASRGSSSAPDGYSASRILPAIVEGSGKRCSRSYVLSIDARVPRDCSSVTAIGPEEIAGRAGQPRPPPLPGQAPTFRFDASASRRLASTTHAFDLPNRCLRMQRTAARAHLICLLT